jgi:hypothetical protein
MQSKAKKEKEIVEMIPVPSPGPPLRLAAREEVLPVVQQAAIAHRKSNKY